MTGFHTFVKKPEAISFPQEIFDLRSRPSVEKEQCVRDEKIHMVFTINDGSK
jgi:hypothetical protein